MVGILGLEPRMTGPESVVLPLHHIPMLRVSDVPFAFARAKLHRFSVTAKLLTQKMRFHHIFGVKEFFVKEYFPRQENFSCSGKAHKEGRWNVFRTLLFLREKYMRRLLV